MEQIYTFQRLVDDITKTLKDTSVETKRRVKRSVNIALQKFRSAMGVEWTEYIRVFDIHSGLMRYQLPENAIKGDELVIVVENKRYPLKRIDDRTRWDRITSGVVGREIPEYYRYVTNDLYEIWPIPTKDYLISSGDSYGELTYEGYAKTLSEDDYSTGTVAVTTATKYVTGTSTVFTQAMVGSFFIVENGGDDSRPYRISEVTSPTQLILENHFDGETLTGANYVIGEIPEIPTEYVDALMDFALFREYMRRKNRTLAKDHRDLYESAIMEAKEKYSGADSSQVIESKRSGSYDDMMMGPVYRTPDAVTE